jgi:hypothetical protein
VDDEGILWFDDRLVVPKDRELREEILTEAHSSPLSIHPGSSKNVQGSQVSLLVDEDED